MKKLILILSVAFTLALTSCSADDATQTLEQPEPPTVTYLYALDGNGNDVQGTILVKTENGQYVGTTGQNSIVVENGKTYKFYAENPTQQTINIHLVLDNGIDEPKTISDINGEQYFDVYPSGTTEIDLVVNF
jgi:hypothetical protein